MISSSFFTPSCQNANQILLCGCIVNLELPFRNRKGIQELIQSGAPVSHRGDPDLVAVETRFLRIKETGGLEKWASCGARMLSDTPLDWVEQEEKTVYRKIFDGE